MMDISFILKPRGLTFGKNVVKILIYFIKPTAYTYFFRRLSEWVVFYLGQSSTPSVYQVEVLYYFKLYSLSITYNTYIEDF